jgi:hypothetical protein
MLRGAKDLAADGVTPALVNAVAAWSDAEVAFYKARLTYYGDRTTEAAMKSAAKTAKARQDGLLETMSWGVLQVYNAELKPVGGNYHRGCSENWKFDS